MYTAAKLRRLTKPLGEKLVSAAVALIDNQICISRARFNDMVPSRAIESLDHDLAIGFGGMRSPDSLGRRHWESPAVESDDRSDVVLSLVEEPAESLMAHPPEARTRFWEMHGGLPALMCRASGRSSVSKCHAAELS